jgi:hypothetical protein
MRHRRLIAEGDGIPRFLQAASHRADSYIEAIIYKSQRRRMLAARVA